MEAAIVEQLRRSVEIKLHDSLVHAPLIYEEKGRARLQSYYRQYMAIASEANLPFLMCTPTWRANKERVCKAGISQSINSDAVQFMQDLRDEQGHDACNIKIGGLIGCKNDCYRPHEGLSAIEAEEFHAWQIDQLAQGGVDFLIAQTLPSVEEAQGIARAMATTGVPYIISFVISRDGAVLDGTSLSGAVELIDDNTDPHPLGFMVNCAYPTFLRVAQQPSALYKRLIGYQANASSLDHSDLDGADHLVVENISDWGDKMLELNRTYGVPILGGCCGTGAEHLRYIVAGGPKGSS